MPGWPQPAPPPSSNRDRGECCPIDTSKGVGIATDNGRIQFPCGNHASTPGRRADRPTGLLVCGFRNRLFRRFGQVKELDLRSLQVVVGCDDHQVVVRDRVLEDGL